MAPLSPPSPLLSPAPSTRRGVPSRRAPRSRTDLGRTTARSLATSRRPCAAACRTWSRRGCGLDTRGATATLALGDSLGASGCSLLHRGLQPGLQGRAALVGQLAQVEQLVPWCGAAAELSPRHLDHDAAGREADRRQALQLHLDVGGGERPAVVARFDRPGTKQRAARERQARVDAQRRHLRTDACRHEEACLLAEVRRDLRLEVVDPLALAVHVAHSRRLALEVRLDLGGFSRQLSQDGAGAGARDGLKVHQVDGLGRRRCRGGRKHHDGRSRRGGGEGKRRKHGRRRCRDEGERAKQKQ
eukprot:scaffold20054_cov63-Phaeocystis_antarctica.AAC.3